MKAVNLLPPDMRRATKASAERPAPTEPSSGTGAYVVLGGLGLAVLAVAGVVLTGNAIKDREAEIAGVKAQQQQIAARAAALKPYADFDQMAAARVATVRDLAGRRFDWEQAIRDLSRAVPADVTLSEIAGNVSTDAGGGGGSGLRSAIAAPAITVKGCTGSQRNVARLMARLRTVDGVTRVSLAKSEKGEAADGAIGAAVPATDSAAAGRAAPCGLGRKPQFEMIMFFEGDADAAAAPSAAPAAPAAADGGAAPGSTGAPAPAGGTPATAPGSPGATSTTTSAGDAAPTPTPTAQGGVSP